MVIINGERHTGKTTCLIEKCIETGYPIIVKTLLEKKNIEDILIKNSVDITNKVIVLSDLIDRKCTVDTPVLIDNLEEVLNELMLKATGTTIDTATYNVSSFNVKYLPQPKSYSK